MIDRPFAAFTCFASSLNEIASCVTGALEEARSERAVVSSPVAVDSFHIPEQAYNQPDMAGIVWEPKSVPGSALFVANTTDGWSSLVHLAAARSLLTGAKVRVSSPDVEWPIAELQYFDSGSERRLIRAMKDDPRWEFFQRLEPLPFEDTAYYAKRRIRDRFPRELLFQYLRALGWDPTDAGLWQPNCPAREIRWAAV